MSSLSLDVEDASKSPHIMPIMLDLGPKPRSTFYDNIYPNGLEKRGTVEGDENCSSRYAHILINVKGK